MSDEKRIVDFNLPNTSKVSPIECKIHSQLQVIEDLINLLPLFINKQYEKRIEPIKNLIEECNKNLDDDDIAYNKKITELQSRLGFLEEQNMDFVYSSNHAVYLLTKVSHT